MTMNFSLIFPSNKAFLVHSSPSKSLKAIDNTISINHSLVLAGSLGALGRTFKSYRPDQL